MVRVGVKAGGSVRVSVRVKVVGVVRVVGVKAYG